MHDESKRLAWLKERQRGIGGSDVAACLGLNPYRTPLQIYEEKLAPITDDTPPSEAAAWGTKLEDLVAKEFAARTGKKVQRINRSLESGDGGWMRANIDRAVINEVYGKRVRVIPAAKRIDGRQLSTNTILECKTASAYTSKYWGPSQLDEIQTGIVESEHEIPLWYETQVQWYLGITGADICYVAVLIGGNDFRVYEVRANREVFSGLTERCWQFWHEHVIAGVPPDPATAADVLKLHGQDDGELVEATNAQAADIGELRTIKEKLAGLMQEKAAIEERIKLALGERLGLTIGGQKAVTWKTQKRTSFDVQAYLAMNPLEYGKYCKTSSQRVFRLAAY